LTRVDIPGMDDERVRITITVPVKGRKPLVLKIPRHDFLDTETQDAMSASVEALDVESELIAVAADLDETPVGEKSVWVPLMKGTRRRLEELGVKVVRVVIDGKKQDEVTAPTVEVLQNLRPYSDLPPVPLNKRVRNARLAMLKHVMSPAQFEALSTAADGQINQVFTQWQEESNISLGEFLASGSSSRSTEAPSTPTSSTAATPDGTSAAV
jgi:hypothetical protein